MNIGSLIGKTIQSTEAQAFVSSIGERADVRSDLGTTYYVFQATGVEFLVDDASSRITTVFLKNTKDARHQGTLPYGLDFGMSRDQARATLRTPDKSNDALAYDVWEEGSYRLRLEYRGKFSQIKHVIAQG